MAANLTRLLLDSRPGQWLKRKIQDRLRRAYYRADHGSALRAKIAPLNISVSASEPARVNLLIPEINFSRFYGGYIAKFHLAHKLTERGYRVRVITVDWCEYALDAWREQIAEYSGLEGIFEQIEVACCFDRNSPLPASPHDGVIATTWWTAHIAHDFIARIGARRFIYLIQEYEPFTFAMGSYAALAMQSYDFPHQALFSTRLLQDYFVRHQIGATQNPPGHQRDDQPMRFGYFNNAIIGYDAGTVPTRQNNRAPYRLLFYARPEGHAARNMFELGMAALCVALERGDFDHQAFAFYGIGSDEGDFPLPGGRRLEMIGKLSLRAYKEQLPGFDIGLALMFTPHPSLLPLEMAAAGMLVVTNACLNKTADELSMISSNLLTATPTIAGVADQLRLAAQQVSDLSRRRAGAQVHWPAHWDQALDAARMDLLTEWLTENGAR